MNLKLPDPKNPDLIAFVAVCIAFLTSVVALVTVIYSLLAR